MIANRLARDDLLNQLAALDILTLSAHTAEAGDVLDYDTRLDQLRQQAARLDHHWVTVERHGAVVAYASFAEREPGHWFVLMLNLHVDHRGAGVMRELLRKVRQLLAAHAVGRLTSHVYKTNAASLAFHHKLGFQINRENERAVEFQSSVPHLPALVMAREAA